jgi:hypothetical protein
MTDRKIEIFIGNSPLCRETVKLVRELASSHHQIEVYDLHREPERVHQYNLKAIPAIAIAGILVITGKPNRSQLQAIGIDRDRDQQANPELYLGMGI